jgi:hypothetical protein
MSEKIHPELLRIVESDMALSITPKRRLDKAIRRLQRGNAPTSHSAQQ